MIQPTLSNFLKRGSSSVVRAVVTISENESNKKMPKLDLEEEEEVIDKPTSTTTQIPDDDVKNNLKKDLIESEQKIEVVSEVKIEKKVEPNESWVLDEIETLECEKWKTILKAEGKKAGGLLPFLEKCPKFLPPKNKVFEAFRLCPFDEVKVVILGQDPYHGPNQAHGLSFSVMDGVAIPPSLRNIYKEAASDIKAKTGKSGNLEVWAKQGVLLLNALLTVEPGKPMSHAGKGWENVTSACISALSKERKNLVFMLWGKPAQEKGKSVDKKKHLVISSSHPSPLGANSTASPFIGSKCFSRCNEYLRLHKLPEIKWDTIV